LGQFDINQLAERVLRMGGDPDGEGAVALATDPFVGFGVAEIAGLFQGLLQSFQVSPARGRYATSVEPPLSLRLRRSAGKPACFLRRDRARGAVFSPESRIRRSPFA